MIDEEKPKKKSKKWWCLGCLGVLVAIVIMVIIIQRQAGSSGSDEPKMSAAKNYPYHEPSAEAKNRNLDCKKTVLYVRSPAKQNYNILCENIYQISPEDLAAKISAQKYDRIMLYGENVIFDANPSIAGAQNFSQNFYNTVKFTDQYMLPKMLAFYGLADLSYISKDFSPYPALFYELEPKDEVHRICKTNSASGCAQMHMWATLDEEILTRHIWTNREFLSKDNMDSVSWDTHWPADCYTDFVLEHETAHLLVGAHALKVVGMSINTWYYIPSWFNEQQAGLAEILGQNLVCGEGTRVNIKTIVNGKEEPKDITYFNSLYPAISLSQTYPRDNPCELGMLSSFYRYLDKGDINTTYPAFMTSFRQAMEKNNDFRDDQTFLNFLKDLHNNDPAEMDFLRSHQCSV
ncbi:MAG: hypothetical protein M1429_04035 [Patescibacteria group bacterium]|nr:hypothetical protein [Patescibacteria group bacterium]